ncbi:unnamed protein product [Rotaria socialis]|uniref:Uncharacterized protein n=4 Tax=Rotaria socialis TaxID=392032 RepID=A0A817YGM4_9BILA|nr:unnamed protein product [Rotaria socialis]CAF3580795.1 unnamed protein product [Rotaria socialis]CAF4423090.1 unnamed protein product [Rotaria socialis]
MQQPGLICAVNVLPNDTLEVQGQRVRAQPDSFWSYYPGDVGVLCKRATSWNPQNSRITKENKDYMTALAKGLNRDDTKSIPTENGEIFSSRWHPNLPTNTQRPGTAKAAVKGRPPTSAPDRLKLPMSTLIEANRPTTAPVAIEERRRRVNTGKIKSALPIRPPPPPPPPAPLRAPRYIDSSGNFDNLNNPAFLNLTDGLKPSIFKSDNHFVHQLCSDANDTMTEQLNTSRDSFLDLSNGTLTMETTARDKQQLNETIESDQEENKNNNPQIIVTHGTWYRDVKSGRIEATVSSPTRKTPREDPKEIERRIVDQETEALSQRQKEVEQYSFHLPSDRASPVYDYKSPFSEEYDQAIALQSQLQGNSGNNSEWNLKEFYREVKTKFEPGTNSKGVFEKCIKLARLQASTMKWEQRRRQNLTTYNRLMKTTSLDVSTANLSGNFSAKNTPNEKDIRDLQELRRELRCNECKRITCLGNCASGQDYHLYKRIVSSIPPQSSPTRQPALQSGSNVRDQHRCKHGCTTCSASNCRSTADVINANAIITSLNNNSNINNNRLRSSKATFAYGQKSQRPTIDLRPRSMHQVTRDMKIKFEQANISPVVVVPLYEDESQSILTRRSQKRSPNGLLPGKSFRSQRRDSLTLISPQKILS